MHQSEHDTAAGGPRAEHAAHTARTAHHDDRAQFVVVADETALAQLEAELALLPLCARGRVFVETASAADRVVLSAPVRMTVTFLPRSRAPRDRRERRERRPEGEARPGDLAARAVHAWAAEMLCEGPGATRAVLVGREQTLERVRAALTGFGMPTSSIVASPVAGG
ncbi:SIP domain-containing protein [Microbacterium sp. STN6]|uniref:SIP domain-containing protein n=1 Tax=Microbacterium sp. STN6 TaxID=2995588 RepID=UPI002260BFE8|nr:SIP domain-containing protein [Microbacterium sp. STN6]MCX7521133.1 SIP domain-containing protein [Microbacterium sp. STN6]